MTDKENKEIKYTPWVVFIWAIGIISTILVVILGFSVSAKGDAIAAAKAVEGQEETAKSDMVWIRSSLDRIEKKVDAIK